MERSQFPSRLRESDYDWRAANSSQRIARMATYTVWMLSTEPPTGRANELLDILSPSRPQLETPTFDVTVHLGDQVELRGTPSSLDGLERVLRGSPPEGPLVLLGVADRNLERLTTQLLSRPFMSRAQTYQLSPLSPDDQKSAVPWIRSRLFRFKRLPGGTVAHTKKLFAIENDHSPGSDGRLFLNPTPLSL